jgi:DNA modification methylase
MTYECDVAPWARRLLASNPMAENVLYFGDNLDILRRYVEAESVDLVYVDPPFKSDQDYNVLFAEQNGSRAAAQIKAFQDTWRWDEAAARAYEAGVEHGGRVSEALQAFRRFLGESDMLAYLSMMAPRLVALHRAVKPTGSLYLHCDSAASHYLKVLLDAVFGAENFRNEIVWQRATGKALMTRRLPTNHDIILCYQKTDQARWNLDAAFSPYVPDDLDSKTASKYCHQDPDGRRYTLGDLTNPNRNRPNLTYEFLGFTKVWRWTKERMQAAHDAGLVLQPSPGAVPRLKRYLDEQRGRPFGDVWTDIPPINSQAAERLGYPTQKPLALLERIIEISSNEGDLVLDPFCGCGTAIHAAQQLGRRWIGIDITHLAVNLIKHRLLDAFGSAASFKVVGEPVGVTDAAELARQDPWQFQWWALGLVGARPVEQKKGADRGIDGRLYFHDEGKGGKTKQIVLSVKAGQPTVSHVRDLRGVLEREEAEIGVLLTMEEPTRPMRAEAAAAGFYESPWGKHPRLQILTVAELLSGRGIDYPPARQVNVTYRKAPRARDASGGQQLPLARDSDK